MRMAKCEKKSKEKYKYTNNVEKTALSKNNRNK